MYSVHHDPRIPPVDPATTPIDTYHFKMPPGLWDSLDWAYNQTVLAGSQFLPNESSSYLVRRLSVGAKTFLRFRISYVNNLKWCLQGHKSNKKSS